MQRLSHFLVWCMIAALALPALPLQAQEAPFITIDTPAPDATVSPTLVEVSGTGTALPENNVIVQALDQAGNVLGEIATVAQAEPGGSGPWSAELPVRAAPGTAGQIMAFSTDPATGQPLAPTTISVVFGDAPVPTDEPTEEPLPTDEPTAEPTEAPTEEPLPTDEPTAEPTEAPTEEPLPTDEPTAEPTEAPTDEPTEEPTAAPTEEPLPPAEPFLSIDIPTSDEVVSFVEVVVVGEGGALPENNVVVQLLADGEIIGEQATTIDAELGQAGEWRTVIDIDVVPGTPGTIRAFSPDPATGATVAETAIAVQYGDAARPTETPEPPAEPAISIEIPVSGEEVSPNEVVVVGTGRGLPENNVVVEALDSSGRVLDQQAATVDAELGEEGEWRVTLEPDVDPGTSGRIYAFARSPADDSTLAEDTVDVRYGRADAEPSLTINSPATGATVNTDSGFRVNGFGANLFEGNVVVEVRDDAGRRIAQRPTTLDANGNWSVNLYTGPLDGAGQIVAFSPSPADNSRMAEDRIDVNFVSSPATPADPTLVIDRPQNGGVVNASTGFTVGGRSVDVFENNVIVQARDANGALLSQVVTTADQNGSWSATLRFLTADGTRGSLYAFSTSPVDGSIAADDQVRVTFASNCVVRTEWPVYVVQPGDTLFAIAKRTGSTVGELTLANCLANPNSIEVGQRLYVPRLPDTGVIEIVPEMTILIPAADEEVALDEPIEIEGEAVGVLPGNVFIRALDADGHVVDSVRGEVVTEPDVDGVWTWTASVDARAMASGTHGVIFAYSVTPSDGTVEASAVTPVIYGPAGTDPYLTIETPEPYSFVADDGMLPVSGRGAGLFEGNVIVRALDNAGNVLVEEPTILDAQEIGGAGAWTIDLPIDYVGRGRIEAVSDSPQDGSIVASAGADVYFGDPTSQSSFALITHPLPNEVYTYEDRLISAAGYTDGVFEEQVFVTVVDELGNILFVIPVEVDPNSGFWSTSLDVQIPTDRDRRYAVNVVASAPTGGSVFARDRIAVESRAPEAAVTGTVTYRERIALPDDAVVTVQVADVSRADAPATVIGVQVIENPGQVPIPFVVEYDPDVIDERFTYAVSATITDGEGALLFRSTFSYPVITQSAPAADVEVVVESTQ